MTHSFLLIGQSNMAGRGFLSEAAPLDTKGGRIKVLRNGRFLEMFRPVSCDRSFAGSSLAEDFAAAYADAHPDVDVGLIPCADGGTSLTQWEAGGILFDNAVNCAKLAMRTSTLVGILWHQGEGDCPPADFPLYRTRFTAILRALRAELGAEELPVLLGGLGDFLAECRFDENLKNYPHINRALQEVAASEPNVAYVPAEGLASNPDNLHFSAAALREFGLRYYEAFAALNSRVTDTAQKEDGSMKSSMELL